MLERDVRLGSLEPLVAAFQLVHGGIKVVEVLVSQELVVDKVELAAGVRERVAVAFAGEVHPPDR